MGEPVRVSPRGFHLVERINHGRALFRELVDSAFEDLDGEPSAVMVSARALEESGVFNLRLHQIVDLDLWTRSCSDIGSASSTGRCALSTSRRLDHGHQPQNGPRLARPAVALRGPAPNGRSRPGRTGQARAPAPRRAPTCFAESTRSSRPRPLWCRAPRLPRVPGPCACRPRPAPHRGPDATLSPVRRGVRAAEGARLEIAYSSKGGSRVQIPPSPPMCQVRSAGAVGPRRRRARPATATRPSADGACDAGTD